VQALKRYYSGVLVIVLLVSMLSACTKQNAQKYSHEFLGTFDTIIQFIGYASNERDFVEMSAKGQAMFERLNKLYDIYNEYSDINNIKTINDNAGIKPVKVESEIIDIIDFSIQWYEKSGHTVNIALGPVLSIWHDYRDEASREPEKARLPDMKILEAAYLKSDINKIEINYHEQTVFLKEKGMRLDLGAVAKGYATELVANELIKQGYDSFAITSGGNVRAVGVPKDGIRNKWGIGIQDPEGNEYISNEDILDIAFVKDTSVVTSGDYQRYYVVDGKRIHHLINPRTLMPADYYRSVTIITQDSGLADFLSSSVFILPYEESRGLVESLDGVEALWVMSDGTLEATQNMKKVLKNMGGATNK